jgi:hypothetical protein
MLCMVIRAVAVWSLGKMAISVPGMLVAAREASSGFGAGLFLASIALELLIIAALWLFADKVAKLALTRPQEITFESSMAPATWLGLLLSAIGAWFFFGGVVNALYLAVRWFAVLRMEGGYGAIGSEAVAEIASTTLEIGLGVVFVLRGQGLSRWIHRLRYGVEPPIAAPTP